MIAMRLTTLAAGLMILGLAACSRNPDTPAGRAADARHEKFEEIGEAAKTVFDQLKAKEPDMAAIRSAAGTIKALAPQIPDWFPAGSGPDDGIRTDALPTVWTRPAEFKAAAARFLDESTRFHALAQGDDVKAIGAGAQALGGACKGCHDKFREEE